MEEICFDNSVASIKGYLVTDLQRGVPYAIKVMVCGKRCDGVWGRGVIVCAGVGRRGDGVGRRGDCVCRCGEEV